MDVESVIERLDCVGHTWWYYPLYTVWWVSTMIIMIMLPAGLSSLQQVYSEAHPEAIEDAWLLSFAGDLLNVAGYLSVAFGLFIIVSLSIDAYYFGRNFNLRRP